MAPSSTPVPAGFVAVPEEGVLAFRGIPYAQPPIGPLRFRPPQKPVAWSGVREAFTYGPAAMQVGNPMAARRVRSRRR